MANLINAERISKTYGTRIVLDDVSVGLSSGDVIGVVGRNGDGKSTLLGILTGSVHPDTLTTDGKPGGRVVRSGSVSIGVLGQADDHDSRATVRDVIVDGAPDHAWAADARTRAVVSHLLGGIDLDAPLSRLSGGERRRTSIVALLLGHHDLLVLDEPTNHLDVEAVAWLATHLNELQARGTAMLVVSHDRWFLDAICTRVWEVHDAVVDAYDGGYAAYVLARAERSRQAAAAESRRRNLLRKELAWLRRGPPARTSKPKFRIDAANRLIEDVPEPRDRVALQQFASARLGKDVFDLEAASLVLPDGRTLLDQVTWSIGPGDRIGLVGVNGAGKTTLLRLLTGETSATSGKVKRGRTLRIGHLSQQVAELDPTETVLESVESLKRQTRLETGKELSASTLLEDFGFRSLSTRIGELSGGERRRLQLLRLLLSEPNVLLLDEPTNDLDIDTLTVVEDHLDGWPGTLIVVSHDRYFLERTCDVVYALMGDGRCVLLPRGVDEYLEHRAKVTEPRSASGTKAPTSTGAAGVSPAVVRQARKDMARIDGQLEKLAVRMDKLHADMAAQASDHVALAKLGAELDDLTDQQAAFEEQWLEAAAVLE
ncbi:MAG TPA: ABC-F family ATP-binding cassette domain-containing protein [Propionibacteriaceae bacterium]|nr:ABC-F family ATP-binding cassette domain-containing protein [Propionibacteriaceae bacterium]